MDDGTQATVPDHREHEDVPPPTGTLFVIMIYMMVLAGMWGAIYLVYLGR